jgi:tetratricopeptide (TPR) repeat protein
MSKLALFFACFLGGTMFSAAKDLPDFDALWDYGKPADTQKKFSAILPDARKDGSKEYLLQLLTQIARTDSLQRKFAEAHQTLDEVKKGLGEDTPVAEVRYLLERGRTFNSAKQKEEAVPLFLKAFELGEERKLDFYAIDAAHMMGIAESAPEKQIEWNLKAAKIAEASGDPKARRWLSSLFNNIGWSYHDGGKFEEALESFRKAQSFFEKGKDPSAIRVAKWSVARALRSLKRYEEALKIQRALEKEFKSIQSKDGYVFEELGELLLATGKDKEAKPYFAAAYEELSKDAWLSESEPGRISRLKVLGGK